MNNNQTIEKLKQMRLGAMAELHAAQLKDNRTGKSTPDEYLALLTDHPRGFGGRTARTRKSNGC